MAKKYRFEACSEADQKAFDEGIARLSTELSLDIQLTIVKEVITAKMEDGTARIGFIDVPRINLQKRIEEVEAEIVTPEPTPEPVVEPTIDPAIGQPA